MKNAKGSVQLWLTIESLRELQHICVGAPTTSRSSGFAGQ